MSKHDYSDFIEGTYTIKNGLVNVNGNVDLSYSHLTDLPCVFGTVTGNYNVSNNRLRNLKGSPTFVGGDFKCDFNKLTSLGYVENVGGDFQCSDNELISLLGCPTISGDLICTYNNLYDFYGSEKVNGDIICVENPVYEIYRLGSSTKFIQYLNEFRPIRRRSDGVMTILGKRLEDCLYMCDRNVDFRIKRFRNYTLLQ